MHLNCASEKNIFVIAATNQAEKVDAAVRRTGRLDKLVYVSPPDLAARREMIALYLNGRPVAAGIDINSVAESLKGYSASDIRFLVDEAARDALRQKLDITEASFHSARIRVPPSIPQDLEAQYKMFEQRGLSSLSSTV